MNSVEYRASWVDTAQDYLEQMRWPWWLPLILLSGLLFLMESTVLAATVDHDGRLLIDGIGVTNALAPSYIFGLLLILDRRAKAALLRLRPQLKDPGQLPVLQTTISSMPFWPTWLATCAGLIFFVLIAVANPAMNDLLLHNTTRLTRWIRLTEGTIVWMLGWTAIYHTVRQLRIIDLVFTRHVEVSLLNQAPLYGLAGVSSLTAVGLAVPPAIVLTLLPQLPTDALGLSALAAFVLVASLAFLAPIYRLHQLLEEQKEDLLSQNGGKLEDYRRVLHRALDADDADEIEQAHRTMQALNLERSILRFARTWPWAPGALGRVSAALLLPILIWLIQRYLGTWIG